MGCGEWDTNSFIRYSTSKGLQEQRKDVYYVLNHRHSTNV